MMKHTPINPFVMSHKKLMQLLNFHHFSFYSIQDEMEHWRLEKSISQAKAKTGTL